MEPDYLARILNAQVYEHAIETPLVLAPGLSARSGNRFLLKREDLQPVFSFKLRGAANKMAQLSAEQLASGVICASAGNHAQGVALVAQKAGVRAVIVMPVTTPQIKVDAVKRRGAEVVLAGESFDEASAHARVLEVREGLSFVHPYDDPDVIAGQGTIGVEILRQHPKPIDAVFCCVGGGGLIAGVAAYIKRLRPQTRIIGVEAADAASMTESLKRGERVKLASVGLFADGAAVKLVGEENFRLCQMYVDEMVVVGTDEICAAIKDVFEDTRSILEPAGALAVAGAKAWLAREGLQGKTVVAVASGANMNFDRLRFVAERAEVGEQREAVFAVSIPERPGSFRHFCRVLGARNITEFNYRYADPHEAHVFVGVAIRNRLEATQILASLVAEGFATRDLSDDELAKDHLRYMVGGRAAQVDNERVCRFVFPERPGALLAFLEQIRSDWNISLFHYRNHGADYGRALVGLQVPSQDQGAFDDFLTTLGLDWSDESANPAYRLFLGKG
ncbi:MAG: threonine ammonia-lyase, biosynthetic [Uliginosibacterium sp.]|jgi:threonine dehydratase|nr:threonine ammonia-lyase, biosynthetic [Uliginosibacterium sp.]